jgi:hypothetical protein
MADTTMDAAAKTVADAKVEDGGLERTTFNQGGYRIGGITLPSFRTPLVQGLLGWP